jgi:hypothetical protein
MTSSTKNDIKNYVLCGICLLLVIAAAVAWYSRPPAVTTEQYTPLPPIKETVRIKRVNVPGPKEIVTVEKQVVVEKLQLPEAISRDANKQVIATGVVDPYEGKTNVVAIMDTAQGTSEIIAKQQPLPLFAFKNQKELGIRGGMAADKDGAGYRGDVYGRWTFLRVGSIHAAIYGEMNTRPEGKAMLDMSYRW